MNQYRLYYWDVPFRGIFPQLFLEEVGAKYTFHDASEIYPERSLTIHHPGMAPPYLYEEKTRSYFAQMPAIMLHLAREFDLLPKRTESFDLAVKTIMDCHDILLEITNFYGKSIWTEGEWHEFRTDRLSKWMRIFELTHGKGHRFFLGSEISVADIAVTALFGTMIHSFPQLRSDLENNAPRILALCDRLEERPRLKPFLTSQRKKYGEIYCGGEIEKSIRKMVLGKQVRAA